MPWSAGRFRSCGYRQDEITCGRPPNIPGASGASGAKIDQYLKRDPEQRDGKPDHELQKLYEVGVKHATQIYYALVCRAALGAAAIAKDGKTCVQIEMQALGPDLQIGPGSRLDLRPYNLELIYGPSQSLKSRPDLRAQTWESRSSLRIRVYLVYRTRICKLFLSFLSKSFRAGRPGVGLTRTCCVCVGSIHHQHTRSQLMLHPKP